VRVLMVSKALVSGTSQRKLEELARCGAELTLVTPPFWRHDDGSTQVLERLYTSGYEIVVAPIRFNGKYHLHYYPTLREVFARARPELVHIDEEPYNYATTQAMFLAARRQIPALFFSYQNIYRRYPPPFRQFELYNYRHAAAAIAGNHDAGEVLKQKGYDGPLYEIPQFGFDTDIYRRDQPRSPRLPGSRFVLGYIGRLKEEKGLMTIVEALAMLPSYCQAVFIGFGPLQSALQDRAQELGVATRVLLHPGVASGEVPFQLQEMDVMILPSLTRPQWKEQFGRTLAEAMACETPVIGSDSGEIPNVVGDAGLIFQEGSAEALSHCVRRLLDEPSLLSDLAARGRRRVLENYTQAHIAQQTYDVYRKIQ